MKNQVAIVTGASRGIGNAIALRLAAEGARLVLCGRDRALLDAAAAKMETAHVVALDQRLPDAGQRIVDEALAAFGGIDIVVNNAGATWTSVTTDARRSCRTTDSVGTRDA